MRSLLIGLLLVACASFLLCRPATARSEKQDEALQVLAEGYQSNRTSFSHIDCRFNVIRRGRCENTEQVLDGTWTKGEDSYVQEGRLLEKDGKVRFELHCPLELQVNDAGAFIREHEEKAEADPSPNEGAATKSLIPLPCSRSFILQSADNFRFTYSQLGQVANIFPKGVSEESGGVSMSPLDLGCMGKGEMFGPYRFLRDGVANRFVGTYEGAKVINARTVEIASFTSAEGPSKSIYRFGIDPDRGYLCTYLAHINDAGELTSAAYVLDVEECSGGRFFPTHSIVAVRSMNPEYRYSVREFKVEELDVDNPPDDSLFAFEIPKGTQVTAPSFDNQWFNAEEWITVAPEGIEDLYDRCAAYGAAYEEDVRMPEEPGLPERGPGWRILWGIAGVALLCVTIVAMIQRRSRK